MYDFLCSPAAVVGDGTLSSKEERQGWEADFASRCIEPALQV